MYNVKREKLHHLGFDTLKNISLRTIRDEWIDFLDLMSRGDVYQLSFEEICETWKHISRGKARVGKSASRLVSQAKPGNFLDDFKIEIRSSLKKQVQMLRIQYKGKENADICVAKSQDVKDCTSLPRLKEVH